MRMTDPIPAPKGFCAGAKSESMARITEDEWRERCALEAAKAEQIGDVPAITVSMKPELEETE